LWKYDVSKIGHTSIYLVKQTLANVCELVHNNIMLLLNSFLIKKET